MDTIHTPKRWRKPQNYLLFVNATLNSTLSKSLWRNCCCIASFFVQGWFCWNHLCDFLHDSEESKTFYWPHCAYLLCSAFFCHGHWFCCLSFSGCFLQLFLESTGTAFIPWISVASFTLVPRTFSVTSSFSWNFQWLHRCRLLVPICPDTSTHTKSYLTYFNFKYFASNIPC